MPSARLTAGHHADAKVPTTFASSPGDSPVNAAYPPRPLAIATFNPNGTRGALAGCIGQNRALAKPLDHLGETPMEYGLRQTMMVRFGEDEAFAMERSFLRHEPLCVNHAGAAAPQSLGARDALDVDPPAPQRLFQEIIEVERDHGRDALLRIALDDEIGDGVENGSPLRRSGS